MSAKHTPGPWQVNSNFASQVCDCDGTSRGCAPIANMSGTPAERKANARLIAAAPDLLEALREVEKHLQSYVDAIEYGGGAASKSSERLASVRAAIAKATGDAA